MGAAFAAAEDGEHAALAPVNDDEQAAQIANQYLEDDEPVATAKAAFLAAFADAEAGGLADKQEPAPEHIIDPATLPVAPVAIAVPTPLALPAGLAAYPFGLGYAHAGLGYAHAGLGYPYASYPYGNGFALP